MYYVVTCFTALLAFTNAAQAQSFDKIAGAMKSGDAATIASYFESNVEITIKDEGNSYSKNQAEIMLKNFFATNKPSSFTVAHEGTSPEGSKYFIGNYISNTGKFRTYVYAKPSGGSLIIQEIRIEQQ